MNAVISGFSGGAIGALFGSGPLAYLIGWGAGISIYVYLSMRTNNEH